MTTNTSAPREFSDVFVRGFKNRSGKRVEIRDTRITGLVMRVTPKNKKTFTLHTRTIAGEKMQMTIGTYNREQVSAAAPNYMIDTKILSDAVDHERVAVNLLADALASICIL